jgi:PIN domain nuclease of toxin-antitoxin system
LRRVLLDTHTFLWWCDDSPKLGKKTRAVINDATVYVSIASAWELSIKISTGKLTLSLPVETLFRDHVVANGFELLPIALGHVTHVRSLAFHHRDPFDRFLAAQAIQESLEIASADNVFTRYGVKRVWG